MFTNRDKKGQDAITKAEANAIAEVNRLLGQVRYDTDNKKQGSYCTIEVSSSVYPSTASNKDPLYGVIVYITPRGGIDIQKVATTQDLQIVISKCRCGSKGLVFSRQPWNNTGIAESFNHPESCIRGTLRLKLA